MLAYLVLPVVAKAVGVAIRATINKAIGKVKNLNNTDQIAKLSAVRPQ